MLSSFDDGEESVHQAARIMPTSRGRFAHAAAGSTPIIGIIRGSA